MSTVTHAAGFIYTDANGHEVIHRLAVPLLFRQGSYGEVETSMRAVALDQRTVQIENFSGGAEEVESVVRLDGDPFGLKELLREGVRGRTLTYRPDLALAEEYEFLLMDHGPVVRVPMDTDRFAFNEWQALVRLRRLDGGDLSALVTGRLALVTGAGPMPNVTFARSTVGTRISADRLIESVATNTRRTTWMERNGVLRPYGLYEAARTQLGADPEAPNSWANVGTPVIATGQADPFGGTAAIEIEDDAAGVEGKEQSMTFTGDGTKVCGVFVQEGTVGVLRTELNDLTAVTVRHGVTVTWQGGDTPPIVATLAGAGTIFSSQLAIDNNGGRWWLVRFSANSVVAANTNVVRVMVDAGTGTFFLAGGNAFDATYPTSWQQTAALRNADQHTQPWPHTPQAASGYWRFRELAEPVFSSGHRMFQVGGGDPRVELSKTGATDLYQHAFFSDGGSVTSQVDLNPSVDDDVELFPRLFDDGAVQLHGRVNGGAIVNGTKSAARPLPAAWSTQVLHVASFSTTGADIALDVGALFPGELTPAQLIERMHAYSG